jgi:hypothetical protein
MVVIGEGVFQDGNEAVDEAIWLRPQAMALPIDGE